MALADTGVGLRTTASESLSEAPLLLGGRPRLALLASPTLPLSTAAGPVSPLLNKGYALLALLPPPPTPLLRLRPVVRDKAWWR